MSYPGRTARDPSMKRGDGGGGGGSERTRGRSNQIGIAALCDRAPSGGEASWDESPFQEANEEWSRDHPKERSRRRGLGNTAAEKDTATSSANIQKKRLAAAPRRSATETAVGAQPRKAPLTSISALFGGGSNCATINSSLANRPKAGTKRPRPVSPTGDELDRMKPPLPAYSSSASSSSSSFSAAAKSTMISSSSSSRVCETTADSIDQASASSSNNASEGDDDEAVVTLGVKPGGGMPRFGRAGVLASSAGARRFEREERGRSAEAEVGEIEDQLWPDKHAPRSVSDLAVHTKKVDEVRHWMAMALSARPGSGMHRLLALVGPPGCAKSTMVRLLAEEMGIELSEWQDTSHQGAPAYRPKADGPALGGERPRHELGSSYQGSLDSFEEFMRRSSYRPLSILAPKMVSRTNAHRPRQGPNGVSGLDRGAYRGSGGGRGHDVMEKARRAGNMVLIEELPVVFGEENTAKLRRLMAECARSSPCPTVIVWSQASEHNSYQSELEQVLSRDTLRLPGVQITTCNPINATLLRQHLRNVLALEGVSDARGALMEHAVTSCRGDIRHALLNLQMTVGCGVTCTSSTSASTSRFTNLNKKSGSRRGAGAGGGGGSGLRASYAKSSGKRSAGQAKGRHQSSGGGAGSTSKNTRDTFLTQFHALGKLLYAKRGPPKHGSAAGFSARGSRWLGGGSSASAEGAAESDRRGPLEFVPEEVLAQGGMTVDSALAFLQYHCVDFYTDEDDLALGLGYMSDADLFASSMYASSKGSSIGEDVYPQRYAESIASRATAFSNKHPAKSRMRAFGAPRSFEMRRIREEGSDVLRRFVSDAWDWSGGDMMALWASSRHPREIVHTELLPAARLITGEWQADPALRGLLHRYMLSRNQQQQNQQSAGITTAPAEEEEQEKHGLHPTAAETAASSCSAARAAGRSHTEIVGSSSGGSAAAFVPDDQTGRRCDQPPPVYDLTAPGEVNVVVGVNENNHDDELEDDTIADF